MRRIIAKCLAKEAKSETKEIFQSLQLGVGVKAGAEAIIYSTKPLYEKNTYFVNFVGYFCSAFNSIKRSEKLKADDNSMPGFAPFYQFLFFTTQTIIL